MIELRGRTVTPGFQDAHVHPISSGLDRLRIDLSGHRGIPDYVAVVRAYADAHPDEPWLIGSGWSLADFPGGIARRETLDAVVADRPVVIQNRDGHDAWVNSRALEIAGITADTPDPARGRIARDPDGTPSGTLHELAQELVTLLAPAAGQADRERALLASQAYLRRIGITAWQDAGVDLEDDPGLQVPGRARVADRALVAAAGIPDAASTRSTSWPSGVGPAARAATRRRASSSWSTASSRTGPRRCWPRT